MVSYEGDFRVGQQDSKVLPLSSALTLAFCACFKIPLSWKKLQMGQTITWIGWEINLSSRLPLASRSKAQ